MTDGGRAPDGRQASSGATDSPRRAARVGVIGLGHMLLGDDALGVAVVHALEREFAIPPEVSVVDAGSCGLDLAAYLMDHEVVIFVDALIDAAPAGSVRVLGHRELLAVRTPGPRLAPHEPAIREALAWLELAGRGPRETLLVGVVPSSLEVGVELSAPVERALPAALAELVGQLERFEVILKPRRASAEGTEAAPCVSVFQAR